MGVAFARFRPAAVFSDKVPSTPEPFPTPRSYTAAMDFLMALVDGDVDVPLPVDSLSLEVITGSIGSSSAAELMAFLRTHEFLPTREEIMANPTKAKVPPKDRFDAGYAAIQLAVSAGIENANKVDECFKYCQRLPLELQTMAARDLVRSAGGAALNAPSITKFMQEHKSLIMSSIQ